MARVKYYNPESSKWEYADLSFLIGNDAGSGGNVNLTGYATEQWVKDQNYLTEVPEEYAKDTDIPTKISQLSNDGGFLTEVPEGYAKTSDIPTDEHIIELIEENTPESSGGGIAVTGATVGQTVKISAIDENGVPTAWEAIDRTHYDERVEVLPETVITSLDANNDYILPNILNLIIGQEYIVRWKDKDYVCTAGAVKRSDGAFSVCLGNLAIEDSSAETTSEPFLISEISSNPSYTLIHSTNGMPFFPRMLTVSIYYDAFRKLDNKYLNLDWIPAKTERVILKEQIVANGNIEAIDAQYLVHGTPIIVYINGIPHESAIIYGEGDGWSASFTAKVSANINSIVFLYFSDSITYVSSSSVNGQSVKICLPGYEYEKIPEEFLPDSLLSGNVDLTGYATEEWVQEGYQPKGEYLTEVPAGYATEEFVKNKIAEAELGGEEVDLSGYAQKSEIPTKVSQLQNDSGYLTEHQSLDGYAKTEDIPTKPEDIGAQPKGNYLTEHQSLEGYAKTEDIPKNPADIGAQPEGDYALRSELPNVPTKVSQLQNDAGYLTEHQDISGKLDASKLQEAINTALAQAKASGEFDGEAFKYEDFTAEQLAALRGEKGEDGVVAVTGATVGQTVKISAVDENGVPTAWEAIDQTHYAESRVVLAETSLTRVDSSGSTQLEDPINLIIGQEYTVHWNGVDFFCTAFAFNEFVCLGNIGITGADYVVTGEPFVVAESLETSEVFIFAMDGPVNVTFSIHHNVLKKLDNKFLGLDWIPTMAGRVILNEQTVSNGRLSPIDTQYRIQDTPIIVYIDGVPHSSKFEYFSGDGWYASFEVNISAEIHGNVALLCSDHITDVLYTNLNGHSVKICLLEYNKIPEGYLPDDIGGNTMYVTVVKSEDGTVTADKTNEELWNAYLDNKAIFCKYTDAELGETDAVLPLVSCTQNNCTFHLNVYTSNVQILITNNVVESLLEIDSPVVSVNGIRPNENGNIELPVGNACYVIVNEDAYGEATADKTNAELWQAFNENKAIYCVYIRHDTYPVVLELLSGSETTCLFTKSMYVESVVLTYSVSITSDVVIATTETNYLVKTVNGQTADDNGSVRLSASDVGADPKGTAASAVSQHNTADDSHNDIRLELKAINDRLTAFFDSDNQTLDELSEIVAYITSNKSLIDSITTSKVSVADIVNNLTSNVTNKPLSAAQGVVLKGLIDTLSNSLANYQPKGDYALRSELPAVPTKVSAFENDKGYLTKHQDLSGYVLSEELPYVTPQMYGAVGDGVTDDTAAFQNALAENDSVFVPSGNYLITSGLDITYKKGLFSDDGQRATIHFNGSGSIINLGRISVFRNINIRIKNAFAGTVFCTNNMNIPSNQAALESVVEHTNIYFEVASPDAVLIGLRVDSGEDPNNIPTVTGICYQKYHDITVEYGCRSYGYGIKMELVQGRPFTEETKEGYPWITHIDYDDVFLGCPHTAIKAGVTNTSGSEQFERVGMGHILFNNVSTQYRDSESTQIFLDLDNFGGFFTKCIGWDYHPLTWDGKKVNIIGENVEACFTNCQMAFGGDFLRCCDFTAETEYTVDENPEYFINKYFPGSVLSQGYDSVDAKIDAKLSGEFVANIAEERINDVLYSGYYNVLDDPLTQVRVGLRWSSSNNAWMDSSNKTTTLVIPLVSGGNIIRWSPANYRLSDSHPYMYYFKDDTLTEPVEFGSWARLGIDPFGGRVDIENPSGYKYASIPFDPYDDISSETMTMTINREITGNEGKSFTEYLNESVITPAVNTRVEEEINKLEIPTKVSQLENDKNYLTQHQSLEGYAKTSDIPTKTSALTNDSGFITAKDIPEAQVPDLSGYALKANAETWTFTLADGSTVTKKVVLA